MHFFPPIPVPTALSAMGNSGPSLVTPCHLPPPRCACVIAFWVRVNFPCGKPLTGKIRKVEWAKGHRGTGGHQVARGKGHECRCV